VDANVCPFIKGFLPYLLLSIELWSLFIRLIALDVNIYVVYEGRAAID
jgi:hypothetical protein